jgi:hypothetical protein
MSNRIIQIIPANVNTYFRSRDSVSEHDSILVQAWGLTESGSILPLQSNVNYNANAGLIPIIEAGRIIQGRSL